MKQLKEILSKILFPHFPMNIIIAILSFIFVGMVLGFHLTDSPIAYVSYLVSRFRAATVIDLCVAITAVFTLQTAMLTSFSDDNFDKRIFNVPAGIAVVVIILGIAGFMIIHSETKIKKLAKGESDNE